MEKENIKEENKFALTCLQVIKENISKGSKPLYNPVCISGLSKQKRFEIFWRLFNKEFNRLYKSRYISCEDIKIDEEFDFKKDLVIIENIELLFGNSQLQDKIRNIINECLENNIQIILCSNENIEDLILEEHLKCRLTWGISLYLK